MADAISRIKSFIRRPTAKGHYLVPQHLIDEAFNRDKEAAEQWFKEAGLDLNVSLSNSAYPISNVGRTAVVSRLRPSPSPSRTAGFSETDDQPVVDAMAQIRILLARCEANQSVLVPQKLVDDAFENDEQAEKWLGVFGYTLIIGRLRGTPSQATVFYRPPPSDVPAIKKPARNSKRKDV
ncbi:hypothetical protein [Variovorax sp. HJSM1_2]|uniref:hypothetical protein n=1 Tax=Variovorax sp. HJSM1_2 TaxID=3366263 RepID=UPI003BDF6809